MKGSWRLVAVWAQGKDNRWRPNTNRRSSFQRKTTTNLSFWTFVGLVFFSYNRKKTETGSREPRERLGKALRLMEDNLRLSSTFPLTSDLCFEHSFRNMKKLVREVDRQLVPEREVEKEWEPTSDQPLSIFSADDGLVARSLGRRRCSGSRIHRLPLATA